MDEIRFIHSLKKKFPFTRGTGIGDDASVVKTGNTFQLISKDILIEGVHFDMSFFTPEEIAIRAMGVNISDISAMGGVPEYLYLGVGFPEYFKDEKLGRFFDGIRKGCERWNVELAGGDISISPDRLFISVTIVGFSSTPVLRSGAREGDIIGITRATGESSAGLELLKRGIDIPYFSSRHKDADPEISKGPLLSVFVNAMIDISDGLLMDLGRILESSGTGAELVYEKIPVSSEMRDVCRKYNIDEKRSVLGGGEDFALLFTISPDKEKLLRETGIDHYRIGKITAGEGVTVTLDGKVLNTETWGYDHFRPL